MKGLKRTLMALLLMAGMVNFANAQSIEDLGNILGGLIGGKNQNGGDSGGSHGNGGSNTIGNLLEGVFSSSNITVADLAGEWVTNGPAVSFTTDNFLKKAGGIAAAAMIEKEMAQYYQQYGLNGCAVSIGTDGSFSMKLKFMTLKGNITQTSEKGVFNFNITALGSFKLGSIKCYAQKSYNSLNLMFDATKFKTLISSIARFTGNKLATTLGSLLDSYEGLCVGFRLDKTANAPTQNNSGTIFDPTNRNSDSTGKDSGSNTGSRNNTGSGNGESGSSGLDSLIKILKGGR